MFAIAISLDHAFTKLGAYFPNSSKSADFLPNYFATVHGPISKEEQCVSDSFDWGPRIDDSFDKDGKIRRRQGLCCNHINFRSVEEFVNKLRKNNNRYTFNLTNVVGSKPTSPLWAFYETVLDTDALELWARMKEGN